MGFGSRCVGRSEGDSDVGGNGDGQLPAPNADGAGGITPDRRRHAILPLPPGNP